MRLARRGHNSVEVVLSRRNLEALLAKLDGHPVNSACTIVKLEGRTILTVKAEENHVHYDRPEGQPGAMHPVTEERIRG